MAWWRRRTDDVAVEAPAEAVDDAPSAAMPRGTAILLGIAGAVIAGLGLYWSRGFAAPVLLALILTICVYPLGRALIRVGVNRGVATGSVIAAVFVLLAAFVAALVVAFAQFAALLPQFTPQLEQIGKNIASWLKSIGFTQQQVQAVIAGFDPSRLLNVLGSVVGGAANITFGLVVILTCLILMAVDASALTAITKQMARHRPQLVIALGEFASGVRRYMVATTGLGVAQGLLNWIALLIMHVPGAFLWGMLSFLCSFIPNVGYFIAIIPPLVFGLLTGGWPVFIAIIVVYGVINSVVQSIIQPRVVGNAVSLSQTITFVSVLVWGLIIGPIGAILAVPLTLLVRTMLIDSDPKARWWRAAIGDDTETKAILADEVSDDKARRRASKAARRGRGPQGPRRQASSQSDADA